MEGDNNRKRGGADDNSNDNNGSNSKIANSNEGKSKPKRQMKTPFQLENLEKAYALDTYPSKAMRAELSEKLGLSDRQLQMWFCHRRLKDKKDLPSKKRPREVAAEPLPDSPTYDMRLGCELGNEYVSGSGSGSSPCTRSESRNVMPRGFHVYYESPQAVIECVEANLGEPLREDGPILGVEFDPLPPDAFGAPIAVTEQPKRPRLAYDIKIHDRHDMRANKALARTFHENQFLPNQSGIRSDAFGQFSQPHLHDPMEGLARNRPCVLVNEQIPREYIKLPYKSSKVVEPETVDSDHDDFMKSKFAPAKIERSSNKRVRGIHDKGRGEKLSKRICDSKRDTSRNVKVTENLSQRIKQQGRGSQGQAGGRGRRTVRKRRVEKWGVEDVLLGHGAASYSSSIGREPLRSLDEDWHDRKASPMTPIHMGAAEASEDDNDNGIEEEDSKADVMREGSDGMANRVVNGAGSDSADSEDSSD